ncbi:MAG: hypothetical protein UHD64_09815 [Bacteroidales bacterium]|nr:hypothetical protein [Bacteroidales bacterium]
MTGISILFGILAIIFALGMIADKDANNRKNFTIAFCLLVIAITVFIIKFA